MMINGLITATPLDKEKNILCMDLYVPLAKPYVADMIIRISNRMGIVFEKNRLGYKCPDTPVNIAC